MAALESEMEQIAKGDGRCWLWRRGTVSFSGASPTERATDHEQATQSQVCCRSKDSEAWNRKQKLQGRFAIDGSSREIVNKYAVCGWGGGANGPRWVKDAVVWRWRNFADFLGHAKD